MELQLRQQSKAIERQIKLENMTEEELLTIFGEPTKQSQKIQQFEIVYSISFLWLFKKKFQKANVRKSILDNLPTTNTPQKKKGFCSKFIIKVDNPYKNACSYSYYFNLSIGDIFMLFIIAYNCTMLAYYILFNAEINELYVFDLMVEVLFGLDMVMRFLQEYVDTVSLEVVSEIDKIVKHYLKGWFIIDFVAIFPLYLVIGGGESLKLIRIFRLPKFLRFLEMSKMDELLDSALEKFSQKQKMNYLFVARYVYKIARFLLVAIILTYFIACLWYFIITNSLNESAETETFYELYEMKNYSNFRNLIICAYFVMTTLTTVGYGDLTPQTQLEKIICILIMIIGIAFFSYIMGNFGDVLASYQDKIGNRKQSSDMQKWVTSLSKFTNNPLPQHLVSKIEEYFNFFWQSDRLSGLQKDDQYLMTMPQSIREELILYIFDDVFQIFKVFLHFQQFRNKQFFYDLAFILLPRKYEPGEILLKQGDNIEEILLILEGDVQIFQQLQGIQVELSFTMWNEKISANFSKGFVIGDYNIFSRQPNCYQLKSLTSIKAFSLQKFQLLELLDQYPEYRDVLKGSSTQRNIHSNKMMRLMAKQKFMNQPDYIEEELIKDFSLLMMKLGKINEKQFKLNYNQTDSKLNNLELYRQFNKLEDRVDKLSSRVQRFKVQMFNQLDEINETLHQIKKDIVSNDN